MEQQINVRIGDDTFSMTSDDKYLEGLRNGFEPHMVSLFKTLVRPNDYVLDIGANIGCTALLFGKMAKMVHAFEPSPTTYSYLLKNVRSSGLANIETKNFGLGSQRGDTQLTFARSNRAGGFVSNQTKASAGHVTEPIHLEKVDDLSIPRVDFIKIDVEGFEKYVLQGAEVTLVRDQPVVALELNHWCLNAFQRTSVPDFLDFLRSIFPILLAVEGNTYRDLHDESDSYLVMYHHIIQFKYANIVAGFSEDRLRNFRASYSR
jgi:FkbM family methyltransferase